MSAEHIPPTPPSSASNNRPEDYLRRPRQETKRYPAKLAPPTPAQEDAEIAAARAELRRRIGQEKLPPQPPTDTWD